MSETKTLDATGLSCPQPAMMTREALIALGSGTLEVLVDTGTARDNCARMARANGWSVALEDRAGGGFRLRMTK